jgi:hypothetical protein
MHAVGGGVWWKLCKLVREENYSPRGLPGDRFEYAKGYFRTSEFVNLPMGDL